MLPSEADAIEREKWLSAGSEITTMLLQGSPRRMFLSILSPWRVILPMRKQRGLFFLGCGENWLWKLHGWNAHELLGLVMPREGLSWTALRTGKQRLSLR